jgi:hypothetical protein
MKDKYETGLNYRVGVNPNLMQDACNKAIGKRDYDIVKVYTQPNYKLNGRNIKGVVLDENR